MEPLSIVTKYALISLFVAAQPGNHNIAMEYEHITTVDTAAHCELLAHDLANLGYPPLANVAKERINRCYEIEPYQAGDPTHPGAEDTPSVLVSQAAYKWSGVSKPIQIITLQGLTVKSCNDIAATLSKMTIGYPLAYGRIRIDNICI